MWASQVVLVVKNLPANAGDKRDAGLTPGSGRSPGGGHGNPLQHSCLENPMDRRHWQAMVLRVAKSQTRLKHLSTHSCTVHNAQTLCVYLLSLDKCAIPSPFLIFCIPQRPPHPTCPSID